jgi:hypothetical protein
VAGDLDGFLEQVELMHQERSQRELRLFRRRLQPLLDNGLPPQDLIKVFTLTPGAGFNGQAVKSVILCTVMGALGCDVFVETGTFRGSTCLHVASHTSLPIWSCDLDLGCHPVALIALGAMGDRVRLFQSDSRDFLHNFFRETAYKCPFFYLDAHREDDIPLLEELKIIMMNSPTFIIVIDDFKVPSDDGFGFDVYDNTAFDWNYISSTIERADVDVGVFYPGYPSHSETGERRGYVVIATTALGERLAETVGRDLLRRCPC